MALTVYVILLLLLCIKKSSLQQLNMIENSPLDSDQVFTALPITNPAKVAAQLLKAEFEKHPEKHNQYWANRTLIQLNAMFPWFRFLIIVEKSNKLQKENVFVKNEAVEQLGFYYQNHEYIEVNIYFTFASNRYEGNIDCYGNLTDFFIGCDPVIRNIKNHIYQECQDVGFIGVFSDDFGSIGVAANMPRNAYKIKKFRCALIGHVYVKKWLVIFALYQKMENVISIVNKLIRGRPRNYSIPIEDLHDTDLVCHNLDTNSVSVPILYASIASNLLLSWIILMAMYLLYKCIFLLYAYKRYECTFGFFVKMSWLFGKNSDEKELDNTLIDTEKLIYTGPNSRVYFARYRFTQTDYRNAVVKVPSRDAFELRAIIEETRIAAQLRHPRVVEYIGFYRDAFGDVRIVSEFMAGGDLHTHLSRRENEINVGHIFNFISQIAEGMEYLISQRIIHRDLATRNCMLNLEGNAIKIADFGLSRHFNLGANYASSSPVISLPLRWMPIECFDNYGENLQNCNFNEKTDIWAFGVVIWECFTRGAQPYGSEDFKELIVRVVKYKNENNVKNGVNGWPLERPEQCPQILYDQVMASCWASEQKDRSTFSAARKKMDEVFDEIVTNCPDVLIQNVL